MRRALARNAQISVVASTAPFIGPRPCANQVWPPPSIVMSFTAVPARQPVHVVVDTGPSLFVSGDCGQAFSSAHRSPTAGVGGEGWVAPPAVRPPSYGTSPSAV